MNFDNDDNLDYQLNKIASIVIREKRNAKGYSLEELATKLNNIVTKQSLYRYETNEARMKNKIFKQICIALGENPNDVWNEINNRLLNSLSLDDNLELIDTDSKVIKIPIFGSIKAGIPIESQSDIIDYMEIPIDKKDTNKNYYGLKISGDSMFPDYIEGDIVIFEQTDDITSYNNKDVAVMINHTESTFKKILINDQGIVLVPRNSAYDMMMFSKEEVENLPIKVVGVARKKISEVNKE